jgi:hypothetical protein
MKCGGSIRAGLLFGILCFSRFAPAMADGWTPTAFTTTSVIVQNSGGVLTLSIMSNQALYNPASCPVTDGYIANDAVVINQLIAAALAAHASGATITALISSSQCLAGRPALLGIWVN